MDLRDSSAIINLIKLQRKRDKFGTLVSGARRYPRGNNRAQHTASWRQPPRVRRAGRVGARDWAKAAEPAGRQRRVSERSGSKGGPRALSTSTPDRSGLHAPWLRTRQRVLRNEGDLHLQRVPEIYMEQVLDLRNKSRRSSRVACRNPERLWGRGARASCANPRWTRSQYCAACSR